MAQTQTTLFPLGAAVEGPNGSDPAAMAKFEAQFSSFTKLMGTSPTFMNAFVDSGQAMGHWAANASWTAWSWAQSALSRSTTPVIGLPMATQADAGNQDAAFKAFAAGQYDSVLKGIVGAWADQGFKTLYFRPGYEMNGTFMPWYAGSDAQTQADWVAAFRHIADVLHASTAADVKVIWNPGVQSWNGSLDVAALYPGDKYVDVVGADLYSPVYPRDTYDWSLQNGTYDPSLAAWAANPVNRAHYWDYPAANQYTSDDGQGNSLSLQDLIDLAKVHNKPIALAETGAGGDGTRGPADDPAFPEWLAGKLAASGVSVAMVNIWDQNAGDADWTFSGAGASRPLEAAAWAKYFGAGSTATAAVTVGHGPDSVVLNVSEDAWQGDAQFTVSVDGKQVGGTLTAMASHAAGLIQAFTVLGNFGAGTHQVAVDFLNDAYGGTAATDRNLYVGSLVNQGVTTAGGVLTSTGSRSFTVGKASAVTLGKGPDSIAVSVSEDAWQGDAQFTISVNGTQIGGTQTATASHAAGSTQTFTVLGSFGPGVSSVAIAFLNDAYGGTSGTDRNLYVDSLAKNGATTAGAALMGSGTRSFSVGTGGVTGGVTIGAGADTIVLNVSEDAWLADAQFTVAVDGKQVGGTLTANVLHTAGQTEAVAILGSFGTAAHTVSVTFLNDAYGGSASTDRNLYVDSIVRNGTTSAGASLMSSGTHDFHLPKL